MKHLLAATAMAALLAAPVWAQTSSGQSGSANPPAAGEAQSGASTPSTTTGGKPHTSGRHTGSQTGTPNRGSRSSKQETAEELNRQELQQIMQGNAQQPPPATSGGSTQQ